MRRLSTWTFSWAVQTNRPHHACRSGQLILANYVLLGTGIINDRAVLEALKGFRYW